MPGGGVAAVTLGRASGSNFKTRYGREERERDRGDDSVLHTHTHTHTHIHSHRQSRHTWTVEPGEYCHAHGIMRWDIDTHTHTHIHKYMRLNKIYIYIYIHTHIFNLERQNCVFAIGETIVAILLIEMYPVKNSSKRTKQLQKNYRAGLTMKT